MEDWHISPETLMLWHNEGKPFTLLDVRDPEEYEKTHLNGRLIPLKTLEPQLSTLNPQDCFVVHCKKGGRSAKAVRMMQEQGFTQCYSLDGGLDAWHQSYGTTCPWAKA